MCFGMTAPSLTTRGATTLISHNGKPFGGMTTLPPGYGELTRFASTTATRLSSARGTASSSRSKGSRSDAGHRMMSAPAIARQREVSGNTASYPDITPIRPNGVSKTG